MRLVISLHDVAPATETASRRWLSLVESHGMRATLLVVPGPWRGADLASAPSFVEWLHDARHAGHELALHGWEHRGVDGTGRPPVSRGFARLRGQVLARGCAEFLLLDEAEARRRLQLGLDALRAAAIDPVGFTPPGWLASPGTTRALRELGFRYTTTQWSVSDLSGDVRHRIPAISQRPGSRLTNVAAGANERWVAGVLRRHRSVRIALHPDDLHHAELEASVTRMLGRAVDTGARACTYEELVA